MEKNIFYWNKLAVDAISDAESFTELYEHFFPRVYKFILSKTANADIAGMEIATPATEKKDSIPGCG